MNERHRSPLAYLISLGALVGPAVGPSVGHAEITVCVIASLQNNPAYYSNATTATRLQCELSAKDYYPTLVDLDKDGWRLIQVVGADHAMSLGTGGPSPLYFLERHGSPPAATDDSKQKPAAKK